jgi:hypothetical protein
MAAVSCLLPKTEGDGNKMANIFGSRDYGFEAEIDAALLKKINAMRRCAVE